MIKNDRRFKLPKLAPKEKNKRMHLKKSVFPQLENIQPLYFYTALTQAILDERRQTNPNVPPCTLTHHTMSDVLEVN